MRKLQWGQGPVWWMRWLVLLGLMLGMAGPALATTTYSDNGDGTITDLTTGLTWMSTVVGTYDFNQAKALTGTVTFAGQSDWRLPNIRELTTIVERSWYRTTFLWSATADAADVDMAWSVNGLEDASAYKYVKFPARLVRGGTSFEPLLNPARPNSDYVNHGNGTVTHTPSGLMWQLCLQGQLWSGGTCNGTPSSYSWDQATALTETFANQSDWHLPTLAELETLVDYSKDGPATNASIFPTTTSSYFWSATGAEPHSPYPNCPWFVDFKYGNAYGGSNKLGMEARLFVRLVRGGRVFDTSTLSVSKSGTGTVSSALAGIDCGTSCTGSYIQGTKIILTATPAANLMAWGGACSGSTLTCNVTMDAAKSVSVSFLDVPVISGLPPAISFGLQNVGSTSATQSVTLSNTGTAALTISSITSSGDYGVTHNCGTVIDAGFLCVLNIAFSPTSSGPRTGSVMVFSNVLGSPHGIALTGTGQGTISQVSPNTLSFPTQGVGTSSAAKTVTLTNAGALMLTFASIVADGDFARTTTCGTTLAPAANCSITVTFTPTMVGARSGSLVINSDAVTSPNNVPLNGTGVATSIALLNPTSLTFAGQDSGTSSAAQTVALTNRGTAGLILTSIAVSGDFAVTNNCGAGLGTGGTCSLSAIFTPTAGGYRSGAISITSNAPGSPHNVSLTGTGVAFAQTIGAITFAPNTLTVTATTVVSASATSGLAVAFSSSTPTICSVSGSTVTGLAAGICTIAADQAGNANYYAAPQVTRSITVVKLIQSILPITFSPNSLTVGGTAVASAIAGSGLTVSFSSTTASTCTVSGSTVTGIVAGTCTIAADQAGNAAWNAAPQVAQSITVSALPFSQLVNLSTRGSVQTGDNVMIGGFVIGGTTPKNVLIRAVGPNLANYGVAGVLADPTLQLFSGSTAIATNNDWGTASNAADIQATGLAPANAKESAILTTLSPGAYTAIVSGMAADTGVGMVEVYELDNPASQFTNISTRGQVLTGDNVMIGGFVIQGTNPKTVLIRAVGPNLANYGVTGVLANPMLQLFSGSTMIASNDDWSTATNAAAIQATGLTPVSPLESAILITLPPGAYTAIVSGSGGGTGVGIVEVYAQ